MPVPPSKAGQHNRLVRETMFTPHIQVRRLRSRSYRVDQAALLVAQVRQTDLRQ